MKTYRVEIPNLIKTVDVDQVMNKFDGFCFFFHADCCCWIQGKISPLCFRKRSLSVQILFKIVVFVEPLREVRQREISKSQTEKMQI